MKFLIKSFFLFFFVITANVQFVIAQNQNDSLSYYSSKALHPQSFTDLIVAQNFFDKAYLNSLKPKPEGSTVYYLYYLASIEYKKGDYIKSEELITEAIRLLDGLPNSDYNQKTRNSFYILMGLNYIEQKNETKALEFYTKALQKATNPLDSAIIYNNISLIHKEFGNFKAAKLDLKNAYDLLPKINDTLTIARVTGNLGVVEHKLDKANGLDLMERALDMRQSVKDTSTIYTSYSNLAEYYYELNDEAASKEYALKAYELAEKVNTPSYKQDALGLLIRLSDDIYARNYKVLNDSLINAERQADNEFALMKYDASEANRKTLEAELENERLENSQLLLILLAIFITSMAVLIYFYLRARHKKEKLRQVFATESRISKQVHDEVANNVFQLMTKFENNTSKREGIIEEFHELYYKARDISNQHGFIDSKTSFLSSLEELLASFETYDTNIIIKGIGTIKWENLSDIEKKTIYKVLQELLINMKKHSKASLVLITFEKTGKSLVVKYSDNGRGTNLVKHTGILNTENRIRAIGGTIIFDTKPKKGFKVKIVL